MSNKIDAAAVPRIGPVIQRLRKRQGLTLEQLEAASGVSKSMLSQIERGQANPTFAVLWSLTRAMKIEFADLLDTGAHPGGDNAIDIVSVAHTPEIRSADGACRLRILSPPQRAGETEWYELEIAPAGTLDSAPHAPGAVEHLTALSAGLQVTSAGVTHTLKPGETARYAADVAHRISNVSRRPAKGLMVLLYR